MARDLSCLQQLRILLAASVLLTAVPAMAQAKRVALIIGNASYSQLPPLAAPTRDANAIADVLEKVHGFSVTREYNLSHRRMRVILEQFARAARGADSAVIYYSGHGVASYARQNYLLPVDMPDLSGSDDFDTELKSTAVEVEDFTEALGRSRAPVQLLVIDACRDIPHGLPKSKSVAKGMAPLSRPEYRNLLISFATEPGRTASDGTRSSLSPFAGALAEELARQGSTRGLLLLLDDVASRVGDLTNGRQNPTRSGNMRHDICLTGRCVQAIAPVAPEPAPPAPIPRAPEPTVPPPSAIGTGRYADKNGCIREADGSFVIGFRSDCK